ncbi:MAG: DUF305 domain-containing protein [Synechococcaceae cyanobacterium RM1_1_27]|nr:DUF305 domain-containing protein [Synechococcaceae cyanobacterium SM2_3_2]NJO86365.1 DUF305 domain-containing protein [Synechococcaceae cyanobacterium RM1_1_27]
MNRASLVWGLSAFVAGVMGAVSHTQAQMMDPAHHHHGQQNDPGAHQSHAMSLGPADEEFDLRFIDGMIPHHEGAVVMAEAALEKSDRPEIRELAEAIIAAQAEEIEQMLAWRENWYPNAPTEPQMWDEDMGHSMQMSAEMMSTMRMDVSLGEADEDFDLRFIDAMIPHHEGALVMAEQALEKSERPEIRELAEAILTSQRAEIDQMTDWRQDWYGQ